MIAVAELAKIPAFPPVAARLLQLLADDAVSTEALAEAIRMDPALTADILQRANSPLFGFESRIDSVQHALALLGTHRIRKIALTLLAGTYLQGVQTLEDHRRCWRHTLATAFLTEELAWACSMQEDMAYTAGLLHDIGRMGLLVAYPKEYGDLLKKARENAYDVLESERLLFGMDHCEAGRQLADTWRLPHDLIVIAGRHHDTPATREIDLLHLAHLGCRLADTLGYYVVEPAATLAVEEIKESLPEAARARFCPDIDHLKEALEAELAVYGASDAPPKVPAPSPRQEPEVEPEPVPTPPPVSKPGLTRSQIALACVVFLLVLLVVIVSR
ncbi:MAG: HDOD domain-containing protein [Acidobacteria bacterium]|nr:HDOD domain-containing protein [Acidobacteriota bacterium]